MKNSLTLRITRFPRQRGVTLVELMLAMAISLIVLLGVGSVYITSKRSYIVQEEYARMQEAANFAFQFLTEDLRQAGYSGCNPSINSMLATNAGNRDLFDFSSAIYGWEATATAPGSTVTDPSTTTPSATVSNWNDQNSADLHATLGGNVLPGTDVIVVKSARPLPNLVPNANTQPNSSSVTFGSATGVAQGQVVMLTDCISADVFMNGSADTASALTRGTGCAGFAPCNVNPASTQWSHDYNQNEVRILTVSINGYFIGVGASGQPALFRINYSQGVGATAVPEELIEGVENMQILYGEDLTNDTTFSATRYVPIDAVTNEDNIRSVRISLLMRTTAEMDRPDDDNTYLLSGVTAATGTTINPVDDRRIRKVFTTTINLRNKMVSQRTGS